MAGANCCFNMLTLASTTRASYAPFQSPALSETSACMWVCYKCARCWCGKDERMRADPVACVHVSAHVAGQAFAAVSRLITSTAAHVLPSAHCLHQTQLVRTARAPGGGGGGGGGRPPPPQGEGTNLSAATRLCATALSSLAAAYALSTCQPQQQSGRQAQPQRPCVAVRRHFFVAWRNADATQRNATTSPQRHVAHPHPPLSLVRHTPLSSAWRHGLALRPQMCAERDCCIRCVRERSSCNPPLSPACDSSLRDRKGRQGGRRRGEEVRPHFHEAAAARPAGSR